MVEKKIGFYGGSFDPIHLGHLNLAIELMEAHHLDEVWFCPTQFNPLKVKHGTPGEQRLKMVKLAIEKIPQFKALDIEIQRPGPSYTLDTLKQLIQNDQKNSISNKYYLLLGEDILKNFNSWHKPEEIVSLIPLLIGHRYMGINKILESAKGDPIIASALQKGLTPIRMMDISSTEIRDRLKKGLYCGHLIPAKVMDYIYQNRLYYIPN